MLLKATLQILMQGRGEKKGRKGKGDGPGVQKRGKREGKEIQNVIPSFLCGFVTSSTLCFFPAGRGRFKTSDFKFEFSNYGFPCCVCVAIPRRGMEKEKGRKGKDAGVGGGS
jgi:hypothetical protein